MSHSSPLGRDRVLRHAVFGSVAVVLLTGCAVISSPPTPPFTPEAECRKSGGVWHASMQICEYNFSEISRELAGS